MKPTGVFVFCGLLVILGVCSETAQGLPAGLEDRLVRYEDLEPLYELTAIEEADGNIGIRQARVTCDLLSFQSQWLSPNHSACAARCLAQRKKGGSCQGGVCHCRN